jgi:hypothetical protein
VITEDQRRMMGAFKNIVGNDAVHDALRDVTLGKFTSFADVMLTPGYMSSVILEMKLRFPKAWQEIQQKKWQRRKARNATEEISPDKKRAIWKLKYILKISEKYYAAVCQRSIQKDAPTTESEALKLIGALNRMVRQKWKK